MYRKKKKLTLLFNRRKIYEFLVIRLKELISENLYNTDLVITFERK